MDYPNFIVSDQKEESISVYKWLIVKIMFLYKVLNL